MMNLKTVALAGVLGFGLAGGVSAATCNEFDVQTNPGVDSIACAGAFTQQGQPSEAEVIAALDGIQDLDWMSDMANLDIDGIGGTSGTWEILNGAANTVYALILKGANDWAVYLLSTPGYKGTWTSILESPNNDNIVELSNARLFKAVAPIPLPAAGFLMLGALGALGVAARRRKA